MIICAVAGLTFVSTTARAQSAPAIAEGARIKVTSPHLPETLFGAALLDARRPDVVFVSTPGEDARVTASLAAVERVEVSRGRQRVLWGLAGAGGGFLLGGVLGGAAGSTADDPEGWATLGGVVLGATTGLFIGAIAGTALAPERWRTVHLQSAPAPGAFTVELRDGARTKRFDDGIIAVRGERDRKKGMLRGAIAVGGLALVFGGIDTAQGELTGGEFVSGVASNAAFGALVGYFISPRGWQKLPRTTN